MLTLNESDNSRTGGTSIGTTVYGDVRFVMSQTPDVFRPRDARDPAAHCTVPDATGQTHDGDCHVKYTANFVCNAGAPMKQLRTGPGRTAPDVQIPFTPGPGSANCPAPPATYKFTLSPQTTWLVGTSSNFGADTAEDPDYVFEQGPVAGSATPLNTALAPPQDRGLSISTRGPVTAPVPVTVTSRDFGGAARLHAQATIAGAPPFDVDVVDVVVDVSPAGGGSVVECTGSALWRIRCSSLCKPSRRSRL